MSHDYDTLSEVISGRLYLTSLDVASNSTILKEYNIDIVVSVLDFDPFKQAKYNNPKKYLRMYLYRQKQFIYYHANDDNEFPIEQYFEPFYKLMESNPNKRVLVHCLIGMSRSATLVLSYLIRKNMHSTFEDHYMYLKEIRPCIDPNDGFVLKLKAYRKSLA